MRERPEDFKGRSVDIDGQAERRAAQRSTLIIRTAKIRLDSGEYVCVLRDISDTGVRLRLFHPLPTSKTICLEMPDGDCFDVEPVWTEDNCAGFRFLKPIDVKAIISSHKDHPKRGLRVNLSHDAYIVHLGHTIRVRLVNLSQQGACIICDEFLAMDERIDLYFDYLSEIKCTVRWRKEPHYGVCFGRTLAFAELATIVAAINHDEALHHPQADSKR